MVTILEQFNTSDGYDIRVLVDNQQEYTFHFEIQPEDSQSTVEDLVLKLIENLPLTFRT